MSQILHQIRWRTYRAVHSNGVLADLVYSGAYYLN